MNNNIPRSYFSADGYSFVNMNESEIYQSIVHNSMQFDLTSQQERAWIEEIRILKKLFKKLNGGYIAFEYSIPRMGKRVDAVIIKDAIVFLLEFKVFENSYPKAAINQVVDYALDLHNFHKASCDTLLFPVLICTHAQSRNNQYTVTDNIGTPLLCNEQNLISEIESILSICQLESEINAEEWINAPYCPTPTIIEAAQALYAGHDVQEISHTESGENDISVTTSCIDTIIESSKQKKQKSICFITGVPGAGKTLIGLNIANSRHRFAEGHEEHAVFLSGNEPLVTVLQEALTNDQDAKRKAHCAGCREKHSQPTCKGCKYDLTKNKIRSATKSFIQMVHWFRDESLLEGHPAPVDKIAIFDEAQRAWRKEQLSKFMQTKKGQVGFSMSEPECLIEYMDRHKDWAVIICLVGGGQEIHDGEAGITEWFHALNKRFNNWEVYCSDKITDTEYVGNTYLRELLSHTKFHIRRELHLSVSMRSFRCEQVSHFAKAVIDGNLKIASELYCEITERDPITRKMKYPILMTRDINKAKQWVKDSSRGSERYGIIASSNAKRLRADGIQVPKEVDVAKWFLGSRDDVDSSYFMELAASEFKIQGLEIDYALVAWEGDYRYKDGAFDYHRFRGSAWQHINHPIDQQYLKNSYRVLLTRARQGYIIYIPQGSIEDKTRNPAFYDGTYHYLKSIGIVEL